MDGKMTIMMQLEIFSIDYKKRKVRSRNDQN